MKRMYEQSVVYSYNRILLSLKKEWTTDTWNNIDKSHNNDAEWKKPNQKKVYYMVTLFKILENTN